MNYRAVLRLTRIEHSIMLVIAVLAAELLAGGLPSLPVLVLSLITPIFISMAAFAINDYFDFRVDKINKKNRPLVTGELKALDAVYITLASLIIGITASLLINFSAFVIAVVFGALAILYSYKLKGIAVVGNVYIAFSMAIPFIFGNYVVSQNIGAGIIMVSVMIFMSGLAREIHGTIRDLKGDSVARNLRTLPRIIGIEASAALAFLIYLVAILISAYLFFFVSPFAYNLLYALMIGTTDLMLLYTGIGFMFRRDQKFYGLARNVSLAAMALALVAILLVPL
jgi:geranylgeranylglycerol-phosphate geranylgeranyltransferase